jgi:hypothetical protein
MIIKTPAFQSIQRSLATLAESLALAVVTGDADPG